MLLANKNAVIYGAGGAVGGTVARAFAREGARLFLVGRTLEPLDALASEIRAGGVTVDTASVDALDKAAVDAHLNEVVANAGSIDISFNLMGLYGPQGALLTDMPPEDFTRPIINAMNGHFITATAAGRQMAKQGSGVILALTAQVARKPYPNSGGFGVACAAIEGLCRQLAVDLGPQGVRVVCLRSTGSPDTPGVLEAINLHAREAGQDLETFMQGIAETTMLKKMPLLADVANVAVLMSSDYAKMMTGTVANVTSGEIAD